MDKIEKQIDDPIEGLQSTIKKVTEEMEKYKGEISVKGYRSLLRLNQVLEYCGHYTTFENIRNHFDYDKEQVRSVVIKLVRDNYVDIVREDLTIVDMNNYIGYISEWKVRRNFEGDLFIESGGYIQQKNNSEAASTQLKKLEERTFLLTVILAVSAGIAAVFYIVELYWKYHWFH